MAPLVSVLVPAYNAAGFIGTALQSLAAQTETRFEAIVVDDGSTDGTAERVAALAEADPRIRLFRLDRNRGVGHARAYGMQQARGEWVTLLDADDRYLPERLERLVEAAGRLQADMVADNLLVTAFGRPGPGKLAFPLPPDDGPRLLTAADFVRGNRPDLPTLQYGVMKPLLRRAFLEEHGVRYRTDLRCFEDFVFYLDGLIAGARCYLLPQAYYLYSVRGTSLRFTRPIEDVRRNAEINRTYLAGLPPGMPPDLGAALLERQYALDRNLEYQAVMVPLKQGRIGEALRRLLERPATIPYVASRATNTAWRKFNRIFASDSPDHPFTNQQLTRPDNPS